MPEGVFARGGCLPGGVYPEGGLFPGGVRGGRITDACKNLIFPQLRRGR